MIGQHALQGRWLTQLLATVVLCFVGQAIADERPPNVVIVYCDDLGYGDLGCYGASPSVTPRIDGLAASGARFTDFYSAQPVCSASRAALLTGCYANRVSIVGALSPAQNYGLHHQEATLARLLKQRQYATAIFGKWHLGHHPDFLPTTHGFDEFLGLPYSNDMAIDPNRSRFAADCRFREGMTLERAKMGPPIKNSVPLMRNTEIIEYPVDQTTLTRRYTEEAVSFIDRHHQQPFFLYVPHSMPHVPLYVSKEFDGKTGRGLYADVLAELDWSVGRILDALEAHQLSDHTLVIFSSDNGPWKLFGNHAGSAGPLRESKATVYDGGIRVPCLARWSGKIPAGQVVQQPAIMMDWFPTIARLTATTLPERKIDGRDLWPVLSQRDAPAPHEALFFYYHDGQLQGMRSGSWKLLFPHEVISTENTPAGQDGQAGRNVRRAISLELYDLSTDVGERQNVAEQHPDVVQRLLKLADAMRDELGDQLTKRNGREVRPHEKYPD